MHKFQMTGDSFSRSVLFQDDDQDYSESGYILCRIDDVYAIGHYGHCSCYGTLESLCGMGISDYVKTDEECWPEFLWRGNKQELLAMATEKLDPAMPERTADTEDYDYDHLKAVYDWVVENIDTI